MTGIDDRGGRVSADLNDVHVEPHCYHVAQFNACFFSWALVS